MDIFLMNISMHYIRIQVEYAPGTHILNAFREREETIYLSCPTKIARLYQIRIPDIRGRIQGYTRLLNFSGRQNSGTTQSTSLFPI